MVRVVDFQGDPVDMGGVTLRGAVRLKTGIAEFGFSRDDDGNGMISWASVPAGMWSYDVFMDDGNEESPLLYGCFVSAGRATPDLPDEQQAVAGAVVVQLPEGSGCVQVVLDNASSAAWYAEQAKKYAENFTLSVDRVTTGEPGTPAAAEAVKGTEAGSYLLSFTIPKGDAGPEGPRGEKGDTGDVNPDGSYNWTQPQTYDAMINADGGVNIPLAAGAPTPTAVVNRMYAEGMAIVDEVFRIRCYLAGITATNNAVISAPVANQVLQIYLQGGMTTTAHVNLVPGILAYNNYSNFAGVVLPVRLVSVSKITFAMGKIAVTARDDLPLDAYTLAPANQGITFGEILDVTFNPDRDAAAGGYHVRVREIYWSESTGKWMVKTTQSLLALNDNVVIPGCVARVVYQQYTEGMIDTDERGALWLIVTGGTPHACQKIATVRGVHNYESFGLRDYYLNITNPAPWAITVVVEAATFMTAWDNGQNPAYYGFKAIETNAIQSENVEEFQVPEVPAE